MVALYIDINSNKIIESNEIIYFILKIEGAGDLFSQKIYVSTVGYWIKQYKLSNTNTFKLYKITSYEGLIKYMNEVTENISSLKYIVEDKDVFNKKNIYILLSPITTDIFFDQPYKYSTKNNLIFDIICTPTKQNGSYIAARNYIVNKEDDYLTVLINNNGYIIEPEIITF